MTFGMLRVKNEARWIAQVVHSMRPVCDRILVLDDHSDDGTPEICEAAGCEVHRSAFTDLQEARDKDHLLSLVWRAGAKIGDYCLMLDGDEVLYQRDLPELRRVIEAGVLNCCSMHIIYLWDRENQIRVDRWYREVRRPSLFRLTSRDLTFIRTNHGGNLHCSSAPAALLHAISNINVRLLHYGYLHRADRLRKYEFYNRVDPNNAFEDGYRHMVIGDLFPADSAFRWAGPLELAALCVVGSHLGASDRTVSLLQ